jgi:hypothetical protein
MGHGNWSTQESEVAQLTTESFIEPAYLYRHVDMIYHFLSQLLYMVTLLDLPKKIPSSHVHGSAKPSP